MTDRHSRSGVPLEPTYTPGHVEDLDYEKDLNAPGAYPFTRGQRAGTGRGGWIHRELSGEGDPHESNRQLKYLIDQGQMGIDVIGDSPTMAWLDPDHPLAIHSVGTQGVSLCCLEDYRVLYEGLPFESITVSASLPPPLAVASLYLVAQENDFSAEQLRGSVLQWPFYAEDCGYAAHMPMPLRLRLALDCIEFCTRKMPKFHGFLEDTYFFSEAGLNAVEEMALGLVEIRHLVRKLVERGLGVDSFAPRIAILVNCSMDFFEEIAKIRATRRLFARMMKEEFGARDRRSLSAVITSHTSGLSLTPQQPVNNIVRGTVQSLALVLAGVQALEISAFDEAYRTPSPESHMVALRTQQILHLESNVAKVVDPLGGSYFVEALTDEMEQRIWKRIQEIEAMGDPADLSDKGWFRKFFEETMTDYSRKIADGSMPKVGLNIFRIPEEEDTLLKEIVEGKIEPWWERIDQIKEYKKKRDPGRIKEALRAVLETAKDEDKNLMGATMDAFEAGATMGEIGGAMRLAYNCPYDPHGLIESPI
jgi:methylmalonyl-CoA mutase N-terminal domain/subunit